MLVLCESKISKIIKRRLKLETYILNEYKINLTDATRFLDIDYCGFVFMLGLHAFHFLQTAEKLSL